MPHKQSLTASQEDYLETIFHIIEDNKVARAKEVAGRLGVSRSSVTEAFRSLAKKGLINYTPYEVITLTNEGKDLARDVILRHQALKKFFSKILAVEENIAESGACRIEHTAPREIIERLIHFTNFWEDVPDGGEEWLNNFKKYCRSRE